MADLNPAATLAWLVLLGIPVGFALLAIVRIGMPAPRPTDDGGGDAGH